jgi:putative acetyltransferase
VTTAIALVIGVEDPLRDDVARLVRTHQAWSHRQTPCEHSYALDSSGLAGADVTVFGARVASGELLGIVALKELDPAHGEVKSMHTAATARGRGVGKALLGHLLAEARRRGYPRVSLETGTTAAFAPARRLYEAAGFRPSGPFAGYANTEWNLCMRLDLAPSG